MTKRNSNPAPSHPAPLAVRRRGPNTESGKATVAKNGLDHGLRTSRPVVGDEREDQYLAFLNANAQSLDPADPIELTLAERVASALWRLGRATRYEDAVISHSLEAVEQDAVPGTPGGLAALRQRLIERRHEAALLQSFPQLRRAHPLTSQDALTIILAVAAQTDIDIDRLAVPNNLSAGVPIHEFDQWTASIVRDVISSLVALIHAEHPDDPRDAAALLREAAAAAESLIAPLHKEVTHAELSAARLARERCVPSADAVDRIIRYEAHVARQFTTALHELHAIQAIRRGETTPVGRIEVTGDPEGVFAKQFPPASRRKPTNSRKPTPSARS